MEKAKIHYLFHDGFIIETKSHILIFDYFNDDNNSGSRKLSDGVISREVLKTEKSVLVFVSHSHGDHFNPVIFDWREVNPRTCYILSSDIEVKDNYPEHKVLSEGQRIELNHVTVKAYGSTDIGISFLVEVDGINIFHAGDLNWWHWKDESDDSNAQMALEFKAQIENIAEEKVDIAFFPVDPRLEEFYYLGGKYFIEKISPKLFIPMHFGNETDVTSNFAKIGKYCDTQIIIIRERGQEIQFK